MGRGDGKTSLKYVWTPRAKGRLYAYYRRAGQVIPIKGELMSYEFLCHYNDIHATFEDPGKAPNALGTWAKLIEEYKASPYFKRLAAGTRKDYMRYLATLEETYGRIPVAQLTTPDVYDLQEVYMDTPRTADYVVSIVSRLMTYAIKKGYRSDNPALKIDKIYTSKGHRPWEEYEITAFRKTWPEDSRERVLFELLLNTGQRGGDVIKMTRSDYRDGVIRVQQNKTGEKLAIPASVALKDILDPWIVTHEHIMLVTSGAGAAFKIDHFRHCMRAAYQKAGLDTTTHGLRYTAATVLKEIGLGWEDIASITGHRTSDMVKKYTAQKRRAARAIAKLDENTKSTKV